MNTDAKWFLLVSSLAAVTQVTCAKKSSIAPTAPNAAARPAGSNARTRPAGPSEAVRTLFKRLKEIKANQSVHLDRMLKPYSTSLPAGCREHGTPTVIAPPGMDQAGGSSKALPGFMVLITPHGYERCRSNVKFPPGCVVSVTRRQGTPVLTIRSFKMDAHGKDSSDYRWDERGRCLFLKVTHQGEVNCEDREKSDYKEEKKILKFYSYREGLFHEELEVTLKDYSGSDLSERDETAELEWNRVGGRHILAIKKFTKESQHDRQGSGKSTSNVTHFLEFHHVTANCGLESLNDSEMERLRKLPGGQQLPRKPQDDDESEKDRPGDKGDPDDKGDADDR